MGQKTNPNSFHIQSRLSESSWTIFSKSEYFFLVKQEIGFTEAIQNFFERNNLLIKQISFYLHNESNDVVLFLSFFPLKGLGNFDKSATISPINNILSEKLFSFLNRMGYRTEKRFVFVNLAKYVKDIASSKDEEKKIERKMSFFKREPFYDSGLSLFLVLLHSKNTASLFSKFIAKYFKSYHRSRKLNKFLNFLQVFIHLIVSSSFLTCKPLKGIKIELKGRFNGVPRSKKKKFESGRISLQTITCPVNYSLTHVSTSYGVFSVKVWICDE